VKLVVLAIALLIPVAASAEGMSETCRLRLAGYHDAPSPGAFAVSPQADGSGMIRCGYSYIGGNHNVVSRAAAEEEALAYCRQAAGFPCKILESKGR
jgi:hypothetical protein